MRRLRRFMRYGLFGLATATIGMLYFTTPKIDDVYVSPAPETRQEARKGLPETYEDCLYSTNVYIVDASGKEIGKKGPAVPFLSYPDDVICMPTDMPGIGSQDTNLYICYSNNPSSSFTVEATGYVTRTETVQFGKNTNDPNETKIILLKPIEEAK